MAYTKQKIKSEYDAFIKQYSRKRPRRDRGDPNDRQYSRKLEEKIKRMRPEELMVILSEDGEGEAGARK